MREIEKLKVDYMGYSMPVTEDEVVLEILGLKLAIKCAEQRMSLLEQGLQVARMKERALRKEREADTTTRDE
jgi:hypothetical protein